MLHVHQSFFAFLHNREIMENGGVFVTRARSLVSLAPKGNIIRPGTDLSKMNPALSGGAVTGGMVGSGMNRGLRDRLIGVLVTVVKGPQKGYVGTIKDTNGPMARVELNTNNKVITIEKERLYRRKWVYRSPGQWIYTHRPIARTASSSHLRVVVIWALLAEASVTEGLVPVAGHQIHMRSLVAPAVGAVPVAALPTRTFQEGRRRHGDRKLLTHTRKGAGRRSIRVPRPRIRTRKRVGGHQLGHQLVHRIPTPLQPRLAAPDQDQDGEVQRPLGVGQRPNLLTLGTKLRPRRPIMVGPVQDHQHLGVGATRIG